MPGLAAPRNASNRGPMPSLRFVRDKRGYENTFVVHSDDRLAKGAGQRILYWFRTPPGVKVGRAALDEEAIRTIEQGTPISPSTGSRCSRCGRVRSPLAGPRLSASNGDPPALAAGPLDNISQRLLHHREQRRPPRTMRPCRTNLPVRRSRSARWARPSPHVLGPRT